MGYALPDTARPKGRAPLFLAEGFAGPASGPHADQEM